MIVKKISLVVAALFSMSMFAQETSEHAKEIKPEVKLSYLDSIKSTFKKDDLASRVDSLWMNELVSLDIYDDLTKDIQTINKDVTVDEELPTELLKQRLAAMNAKSPFEIEYNQGLENIIKSFLKNRKKSFSRLMALSEYYFPIFEETFAKEKIPLEIKYLAVVESALNPKAVSKMGATGLWQFMYGTGKQYALKIDSYIDERSDPLKATAACSDYMTRMFSVFNDWELVLASYNSGPGNVTKAIRRSGGKTGYWDIRNYLPKETQGYVPAFYATMYLFEYHKEHGINPERAVVKNFETDTVGIKNQISFKQLADLLDMPQSQLQLLNPSYKLNIVPAYHGEMNFLRLPKDKIAAFVSNEDKIYAYVEHESLVKTIPTRLAAKIAPKGKSVREAVESSKDIQFYKVRKGDNLGTIADKYNVNISDLKKWNNLKTNAIALGRTLKIKSDIDASAKVVKEPKSIPAIEKNTEEAIASNDDKDKVSIQTVEYVVAAGDNLGSIAKKFGTTIADLKELNDLTSNNIGLGKTLVVSKIVTEIQEPVTTAIASNSVDAFKKKAPSAKSASEDYYVKKGDSLYSISKKYPGVTISDIKKWNGIKDEDIKPGMKLKING
ncbi:lytic transglycosylase [Flavobacterium johnsoniae]|uniref:Candidate lytic murein transglycosylase Glycoside hydrolase family 23 n=1 Tax=Flavobacterium johnsoniae (strain ATCC 17061 / DSM 2064 / JCM 8514 / BCRC 14874 / CCUG 350202 / NBRC 14942 / NCIMB 11054 / UW101) TaxID=376686 RepID=A5FLA5_FLAJ1|nr:LysM peptidoglycan-binding domain-containing protein [Flavobacterium johnsoniae]ABQ04009.1 Candidate lytic murein transglycosylase; Glycoside hydrolase family 23 [Flavobacterium johnsoniae UW101]OXE96119.1 lytic transglycosylase [Flavobacterium johnsoniae UW101]WQG79120.1 LysM peptidoglycan-binding domain-containing protein [Flavobacterium johnsoniae UW101]SHK09631.1 membrane-bound lytic murein transglycosylase D [Flavobacterium johnsoniae]